MIMLGYFQSYIKLHCNFIEAVNSFLNEIILGPLIEVTVMMSHKM